MITFQDSYEQCQEVSGDYSTSRLTKFKRDINQGGHKFLTGLGRKFAKGTITADLAADQQYYQLPGSVIRVSEIRIKQGTEKYPPLHYVVSELEWNLINTSSSTSNLPTHYYIRGSNELGLYPIPSGAVTDGLELSYDARHATLRADDYTTGTVTVAEGDATVTHSATGFTPQMVGRYLEVDDGTDSHAYRIASYTSSSVIELENFYEGISGSGRSFRIGEALNVPEDHQDAGSAWALYKYYLTQKDRTSATDQLRYFKDSLKDARTELGRSTSRMGVRNAGSTNQRPVFTDRNATITYP
jgi:hypothetical protein